MIGIRYMSTFCCPPIALDDDMESFIEITIEMAIRMVKPARKSPTKGIVNGRFRTGSGAERSAAHRNDSPRSTSVDWKKRHSAISSGYWSSIGRQPPSGFTPASL